MRQNETKKLMVIDALSNGHTVDRASEIANVSRATVYRWCKSEKFLSDIRKRNSENMQRLNLRLIDISARSLDVLDDILSSSNNDNLKLRAVGICLSRMVDIVKFAQFEDRLRKLESQVGISNDL